MVEADSHLKLLPTSNFDINKVFEHFDILSTSIQWQPYTVIPRYLVQILGFWVTFGVNMMSIHVTVEVEADSHLKLLSTST